MLACVARMRVGRTSCLWAIHMHAYLKREKALVALFKNNTEPGQGCDAILLKTTMKPIAIVGEYLAVVGKEFSYSCEDFSW